MTQHVMHTTECGVGLCAVIDGLSALLTPLIALIAVYIAYQQWQTNRRKLQLDLYEGRLRVYQAVAQFVSKVAADASVEQQDISDLWRNAAEADFLFGSDVRGYLKELTARAIELRKWNSQYRDDTQVPPEGYDHSKVSEGMDREVRWFADQPEKARQLFGNYLNLAYLFKASEQPSRPCFQPKSAPQLPPGVEPPPKEEWCPNPSVWCQAGRVLLYYRINAPDSAAPDPEVWTPLCYLYR